MDRIARAACTPMIVVVCGALCSNASAASITELPASGTVALPLEVAVTAGGAVYVTDNAGISQISPQGVVSNLAYGTVSTAKTAEGLTIGPDGNPWWTMQVQSQAGTGVNIVQYFGTVAGATMVNRGQLPDPASQAYGLVSGPDGALWTAQANGGRIGRLTTSGVEADFGLSSSSGAPDQIAVGSDGAMWFTDIEAGAVGRITTTGQISEQPITYPGASVLGITSGSDGALWFTENLAGLIGRVTTAGAIQTFPLPAGARPASIVSGHDGALWFTDQGTNAIGRITTAGQVTEYPLPTANAVPSGIATAPDGTLWFAETNIGKIGHLNPAGQTPVPKPTAIPPNSTTTQRRARLLAQCRWKGNKAARRTCAARAKRTR